MIGTDFISGLLTGAFFGIAVVQILRATFD